MRKFAALLLLVCLSWSVNAQQSAEEKEVRQTIDRFFEGFHARDSIIMKSVLAEDAIVQTIGKSKSGELAVIEEELGNVLKGIVSIPLKTDFKETLHSYEIKVDGPMANAWTPYSLHVNDSFSHCGVNNFQLFKDNGEWKIIYLIDTRRKEGCDGKKMK